MLRISRLVFALALSAGASSCKAESLSLRVGMTATELNAQPAIAGRFRRPDIDWVGHNGPLSLRLLVNERSIDVPISGVNGGIQLSTWRGLEADYPEPRLNTVLAAVAPQRLDWEEAFSLAERLCVQARQAGLTIYDGPTEPNTDRDKMNGVAACNLRDEVQSFEARVAPLGMPPSGKYRVEVALQAHFKVQP